MTLFPSLKFDVRVTTGFSWRAPNMIAFGQRGAVNDVSTGEIGEQYARCVSRFHDILRRVVHLHGASRVQALVGAV